MRGTFYERSFVSRHSSCACPSPRQRGLELLIPRRAILFGQQLRGVTVICDLLFLSIPAQGTAQFHRKIGQMAGGSSLMATFQIGDGLPARLHALQKVTNVRPELVLH